MNITNITNAYTCVGCGVCAAVCPRNHLVVGYNRHNQLIVQETDTDCFEHCAICRNVCPFSSDSKNEDVLGQSLFARVDGMRHDSSCGYYLNAYVGWTPSEEHRMESASGGLTSYLLEVLLRDGYVDAALVVRRNEGRPFFSFTVCRNADDVYKFTRSAYCAVSIEDALRAAINDDSIDSLAVVALPCVSKALRNACSYNTKLRKKLKYVIGLTCGQQKSHNFAEYLATKKGVNNLRGVDFRRKREGRPNSEFSCLIIGDKGTEITFPEFSDEWSECMFTVPACNLCDDVFAETADVVLMDAWDPEFGKSDKGENFVIVRNKELDVLFSQISTCRVCDVGRVIRSQSWVIDKKRCAIVEQLDVLKGISAYVPVKRRHLFTRPTWLQSYLIRTKYRISLVSDSLWVNSEGDYSRFRRDYRTWARRIFVGKVLNKIHTIINRG